MIAVRKLRHQHALTTLCRVLGVNRSSYYKHYKSKPSARSIENQEIRSKILNLYSVSKKRLGARKMQQRLSVEYGIKISLGRIYRLMKAMDLPKMSTVKPYVKPGKAKEEKLPCPNHVNKNFSVPAQNLVWVSDISYVKVGGKFCYVCVIIDLFSRKVIAYQAGEQADTQLVVKTFLSAFHRPNPELNTLIFHSDRGCQYTSKVFRDLLDSCQVTQSFSAPGYPFDNAVAESFFKYLKKEELDRRKYSCIEDLKLSLFQFIVGFYNSIRPHSANDMLSPDEKEASFV